MDIEAYITELNRQFGTGNTTEHSYRPALQALLESALPDIQVTNEPQHIECGAPDFVLTHNNIPIGYIEAKDIGKNLDTMAYQQQLQRYTKALDNLIFTDYLEFRLYRAGAVIKQCNIATIINGHISAAKNTADLNDLLQTFRGYQGHQISSADELAEHMAAKTRMLAAVMLQILNGTEQEDEQIKEVVGSLHNQLDVFKDRLISDLDAADFADIYAQTIAYGMFAARLHDRTSENFSRQKAAELIPASNPFLKQLFRYIAGYELDQRLHWIVNALADLFRATDVGELMKDYGKTTQRNDPFLHFYETFLGQYDPALRKSRGVYYTPEPVVSFMIQAVDSILCSEFGLAQGLADTCKTTINTKSDDGSREKTIHKVQILDPAAGTGTFLAAIVQYIYNHRLSGQQGLWQDYLSKNLIPRLNGFEVMMAPYVMAHTKLEMVLREHHCELNQRLRIFLTNSLEEQHPGTGKLFAEWLAAESREANTIKRETPVMVVIGNPPYSGESANKGEWITDLLKTYKQEPGGGKLQEKNPKWLNDDYVKFIRCGQHYIDRSGEGVLAYINNHSFLDNPTFRGMRWSLLQSFDKIYILDLHGNAKKKETAPDGSKDENVFDIQQGVSVNLFIKTGNKKQGAPAQISHADVYGKRANKYQFLWDRELRKINFQQLKPQAPQYYFVPRDDALQQEYEQGFLITELLPNNSVGIVTARDRFTIHHTPQQLETAINKFRSTDDETAREQFALGKDVREWKVSLARADLEKNVFGNHNDIPVPINYRPFDIRHTYYTGHSKGFHCRPRGEIMRHFIAGENIGLIFKRGGIETLAAPVFITKYISDHRSWSRPGMRGVEYSAPLYLYPDPDKKQTGLDDSTERQPNLNQAIVKTIADGLGLSYTPEKSNTRNTLSPLDILDYTYAVLHSPTYRERYQEFLKTDFPRLPYPTDKKQFRRLVKLGSELRALHLMTSPKTNTLRTRYPETGDNVVTKLSYKITGSKKQLGKVYINKTQYFENVPEVAWNFYIGGYQPAQKWLKDRKGMTLSHEDIMHYQKIIMILCETDRCMQKIDRLTLLPG